MESRSDELYHALCEKGYPDEFCRLYSHANVRLPLPRLQSPPGGRSRRNARNPDRPRSNHPKERTGTRPGNDKQSLPKRAVKI